MSSLFDSSIHGNLLPEGGHVEYYGTVLSDIEASAYFKILMENIVWKNDEAVIYGKHIITKRKVAWYADKGYSYTYSNTTKYALPWTDELLELKSIAELKTKRKYNACLLNLYHSGEEGMTWHSDDENELIKHGGIASMSLGAERKFVFKNKADGRKVSIQLENGSLLLMAGETQDYWLHSLPKTKRVTTPRINLTFRRMREPILS